MNRRGTSLVELLVVIVVNGAVLALIAALTGAMLRSEAQARQAAQWTRQLARLSLQFRADAHAANEARIDETPPAAPASQMTLVLGPNDSLEYRAAPGRVDRIRSTDGAVVHRDSFFLADNRLDLAANMRLETSAAADRPSMVAIVIDRRAAVEPAKDAATRVYRLEALLGRERRQSDAPPAEPDESPEQP